ncbi:MAG: hypothetical protein GWO11_05255 [Desulfuromonadales bacterium]|nr:hypothetical protein [Desulfuromonadales bacterium]NIR33802.1 hypothetical protein [Desulfuromonadales bacterium]NIS42505.1 hypothetical protein [Desulfuromonadales bacterium]
MGFFIGGRSLWLMAGGALGVMAALSFDKTAKKVRPAAVGAVKEGYAFKEWVATRFEQLKEDVEDIVAEAVYEQEKESADAADAAKREEELLKKVEKMVEERLAKIQTEAKEG